MCGYNGKDKNWYKINKKGEKGEKWEQTKKEIKASGWSAILHKMAGVNMQ